MSLIEQFPQLGFINRKLKPIQPQIFLAKPNKTVIAKLKEAYGIKFNPKLGKISELNFNVPYFLEEHHKLIENPNLELCKERYLIKFVLGNYTEWFRIQTYEDMVEEDFPYKSFKALGLGIELNDVDLAKYNVESYNLKEILEGKLGGERGLLYETNWTVGYVDSDFLLKYRSYNFDKKRVLQAVTDIAEVFNALILWDTKNRKLNFYSPERIGQNRGLIFSQYKYLKSLNHKQDMDNVVTRLKVFGRDSLSINRVNPTGQNYIDDFSFYIYPFERDENKNVIKHSYYMSDSLCHALLDYKKLLESKEGVYASYLDIKRNIQEDISERNNELVELERQLEIIRDRIYVAQTSGQNASQYQQDFNNKQVEINYKKSQISSLESDLANINSNITALQNEVSANSNFTQEQLSELKEFIVQETWIETNHIDDEKLYEDAKEKLKELHLPQTIITIDIVNFLEVIEEQWNWDKLVLGDIVTIKHELIRLEVQAKIIELEYDFEDFNINLTIANVKKLNDERSIITDIWNNSINTSNSLLMNQFRWDGVETELGYVGNIIKQFWNDTKQEIDMAINQNVTIDRRGITIIDPNDPLKFLRATNGVLALTGDGGNTFRSAITPDKIVAEEIMGMIISGERVIVSDPDGILVINGNKMTISNRNYQEIMKLGLISESPDCFGMVLENDKNRVTVSDCAGFKIDKKSGSNYISMAHLDTDGILTLNEINIQNTNVHNFTGTLTNGITINAENGIVITRDDNMVKVTLNATNGITIDNKKSGSWETKLWADTDGVLHVEDLETTRILIRDGDGHIIIDANSKFLDLNQFNKIDGNIKAENISTNIITANEGFIHDLTVNQLKTLGIEAETGTRNYIHIKDHEAKWITGTPSQSQQAKNHLGEALYWFDDSRTSMTTEETPFPVMTYNYSELVKMKIYFKSNDPTNYPIIEMGAGGLDGLQMGYIYKDNDGLQLEYITSETAGSHERAIRLVNDGIFVDYNNDIKNVPIGIAVAGSGNFKSPVTFSGGVKLPNTNYSVIITMKEDAQGFVGEWWISNKSDTGFQVDNSGSATTAFDYAVVMWNN